MAIGLSMMAWASVRRHLMTRAEAKRIDNLLKQYGFNLELPVGLFDMLREARFDKKKFDDKIDVVMPRAVGDCIVEQITFKQFESMFL